MNLKSFAQTSRTVLMEGVVRRLAYWGFRPDGATGDEPQKVAGGYIMRGDVFDDAVVPERWSALKRAISAKGFEEVVEEAAYTWFNRMVAMQVLAKNDYEIAQLEFAKDDDTTPLMLQRARRGDMAFLDAEEQSRVAKLLATFTKDQEAFAQLLTGYCRSHRTLSRVFGKPDDYTELLLPDDMLQEGGFLHLLNTAEALTDDEFQKVELIGWLYQFYISEKKDEVFDSFGKGKKAEAKDIPAATQIFTPNWIVKYMVENTAGKVWLDKHPNSPLKGEMKYLVENESDGTREPIIKDVEELTLIDPACGSGHILVEGFDLLYKMHMERYYSPEDAVDSILKHNLYGLDIDDRAAQLATFAVLLKAAQCDRNVWSRDVLPNVHSMPEKRPFGMQEVKDFLGKAGVRHATELDLCLMSMQDAKNRGSVMKLKLSSEAHDFVSQRFNELKAASYRDFNEEAVLKDMAPFVPVLLALTRKFTSVVANPPYMVSGKMNDALKAYASKSYPHTKGDLGTIFMEVCNHLKGEDGAYGMINQMSWMFKSSYFKFRERELSNLTIDSLLHLGSGTFREISGDVVQSTAFVIRSKIGDFERGKFFDLTGQSHSEEKRAHFESGQAKCYHFNLDDIGKLRGHVIGYWVSNSVIGLFQNEISLESIGHVKKGIASGDDKRFFRFWFELAFPEITLDLECKADIIKHTWFPINKGGGRRKWSGNFEAVVNWANDGEEIRNFRTSTGRLRSRPQNLNYSFDSGITYNIVSSRGFSGRLTDRPSMMADVGPTIFYLENPKYVLGLLNSEVGRYFFKILCPGYKYDTGAVGGIPVKELEQESISYLVSGNVEISKRDWDSKETSWDFEQSPLLNQSQNIEASFYTWVHKASDDFFQLHKNEEELNRIFIDIYGLQDELTPEVALKDITILQEELDKKDLEALESTFREHGGLPVELPIDRDEVMRQFVSYCVGLMMGRYRLDKPGLNIAHPNPSAEELSSYEHNGHRIEIDDDAILPLMGSDCQFPDDVLHRMQGLLDAIWGGETRTANLNFLQACLGKDLEKYLVKDFFKDHCKRYKKKPIYWLFSSPKGAFQVLAYMHRMNAFTVEKIRSNYLLDHLRHLRQEEQLLAGNEAGLSSQDGKRLDQLRKDIAECEAYDLELKDVADAQISFDLDAGVTENHKLFGKVVAKIK